MDECKPHALGPAARLALAAWLDRRKVAWVGAGGGAGLVEVAVKAGFENTHLTDV